MDSFTFAGTGAHFLGYAVSGDFTANWHKSIHKIGVALKEIEPQTRKNIIQIMKSLFDIISLQMKERRKSKNELQREKFEQGIAQLEQMFTKSE